MEENFSEETDAKEEEKYEYPSEILEHNSGEFTEDEILNEDNYTGEKQEDFSAIMGKKTKTFLISSLVVLSLLVVFLVFYIIYN